MQPLKPITSRFFLCFFFLFASLLLLLFHSKFVVCIWYAEWMIFMEFSCKFALCVFERMASHIMYIKFRLLWLQIVGKWHQSAAKVLWKNIRAKVVGDRIVSERTQNSHVFMRFLSRFQPCFETVLITYIIVSVIAIVVLFIFFSQFSSLFILRSVCDR